LFDLRELSMQSFRVPFNRNGYIPNDAVPTRSGEDTDLFVGKNKSITMTLANGTITRFRDVVVLGELTIQASDPTNIATKPRLIARDFFCAGDLLLKTVDFQWRNGHLAKNRIMFRNELQELFLEWADIQRESVARIGLKSILT
jgi:hypothetical protein